MYENKVATWVHMPVITGVGEAEAGGLQVQIQSAQPSNFLSQN